MVRQFLSVVHTNLEPTVFLPQPLSAKMYLRSEIPKLESEGDCCSRIACAFYVGARMLVH